MKEWSDTSDGHIFAVTGWSKDRLRIWIELNCQHVADGGIHGQLSFFATAQIDFLMKLRA
jgi:hypothetical protein